MVSLLLMFFQSTRLFHFSQEHLSEHCMNWNKHMTLGILNLNQLHFRRLIMLGFIKASLSNEWTIKWTDGRTMLSMQSCYVTENHRFSYLRNNSVQVCQSVTNPYLSLVPSCSISISLALSSYLKISLAHSISLQLSLQSSIQIPQSHLLLVYVRIHAIAYQSIVDYIVGYHIAIIFKSLCLSLISLSL